MGTNPIHQGEPTSFIKRNQPHFAKVQLRESDSHVERHFPRAVAGANLKHFGDGTPALNSEREASFSILRCGTERSL